MFCYKCPAVDIDSEDISCTIYEDQREIGNTGQYGCNRRSEKAIKKEMDRVLNDEIKALEEMYYNS